MATETHEFIWVIDITCGMVRTVTVHIVVFEIGNWNGSEGNKLTLLREYMIVTVDLQSGHGININQCRAHLIKRFK